MTQAIDVAWRPDRPHNQLPPLPPAQELESRQVLKACNDPAESAQVKLLI